MSIEARVRLEIGVGIEVGDLDRIDRVKLAANQYINFTAVRGRLTSHLSTG
jgi:hypothetical protein